VRSFGKTVEGKAWERVGKRGGVRVEEGERDFGREKGEREKEKGVGKGP
jgi:hypothetical protein